ncbi:hypothetical protein M3194_20270 [Paenibacillus glycanilyticus]|uniref:hypothetical protein n=1 Tax=Paenibacillus glycanilyticus TaxID=126569 RepID=UPI00203F1D2D|nr:hypothetical protein [Paenibacillus glycanilyticus]MCM3629679.1 hypothetical protein [Paenibacillus glycanilyticus]
MTKRWSLLAALTAVLLATAWFLLSNRDSGEESGKADRIVSSNYGDTLGLKPHRLELQQFIENKLTGESGVYTNYRETDEAAEMATGHETLSESAGLLMRYYALTGQKEAFDAAWSRAKQTLSTESGFSYRYSPLQDKRYPVNAVVDDLRIIRALYEAEKAFGGEYGREAAHYGGLVYEHNVRGNRLYDFYDETYKTTNDFLTLCYADFQSIRLLEAPSRDKKKLEDKLLAIVSSGYLSDKFPFYETRYEYKTDSYVDHDGEISTIESLLTVLSLAEIGQERTASITYLKQSVEAGTLYGRYHRDGRPATDIQSTAAYAIAAMIGSTIGDKALYEGSLRRMEQYRVEDEASPLAGSFGNAATEEVYSFDNLSALLAYAY